MKFNEIAPLEMQEYLNAETICRRIEAVGGEPASTIDLAGLSYEIRRVLHLHRLAVAAWFVQNGQPMPTRLVCDEMHPAPGCQTVDELVVNAEARPPACQPPG